MAINLPKNQQVVVSRILTDIQNYLSNSQPFIPNAYLGALGTAQGGRMFDAYSQVNKLLKEMFPDTATLTDFLVRWGSYRGINIGPATQAKGSIVVFGNPSTNLPLGTQFTINGLIYSTTIAAILNTQTISCTLSRQGNVVYATTSGDHHFANSQNVTISNAVPADYNGTYQISTIASNQFSYRITTTPISPPSGSITASYNGVVANVESQLASSTTNQLDGVQLTILTPIADISNTALVNFDQIDGGADQESNENYLQRVLFSYRNPHALFNVNDIVSSCLLVRGISRVFVLPITPQPGFVTVYLINDTNPNNIIPSPSLIAQTKTSLVDTILPAFMDESMLIMLGPTAVNVPFTFTSISPSTQSMKDAITLNLQTLFTSRNNVGEDLTEDAYKSAIYKTVDIFGNELEDFNLSTPTTDIAIADGEIAMLDTIIYPST